MRKRSAGETDAQVNQKKLTRARARGTRAFFRTGARLSWSRRIFACFLTLAVGLEASLAARAFRARSDRSFLLGCGRDWPSERRSGGNKSAGLAPSLRGSALARTLFSSGL